MIQSDLSLIVEDKNASNRMIGSYDSPPVLPELAGSTGEKRRIGRQERKKEVYRRPEAAEGQGLKKTLIIPTPLSYQLVYIYKSNITV